MVGYLVYVTLDLYKNVKIDRENHQVGFFKKNLMVIKNGMCIRNILA